MANGTSEDPNGGFDFGIDTPGTTTRGRDEAFLYAKTNGLKVLVFPSPREIDP
jgi:hypothetical protein